MQKAVNIGRAGLLSLSLSSCTLTPEQLGKANVFIAKYRGCSSCGGSNCYFINSPVRFSSKSERLPGRDLAFYANADNMKYVDGDSRRWVATRGTLTDGASIPALFVPITGNLLTPEFANAGALNDSIASGGISNGSTSQP